MNSADVCWVLICSALVLIMTPGLSLFYGGMVQKKNVISTMFQSFISMALMTLLWVVVGFSLSFGESFHGVIGNPVSFFMLEDMSGKTWSLAPTIPLMLFAFFQLKFAIITPALITGAFAERIKFKSYLIFITLFSLFIYCPLAHMTWHPDGILFRNGVLDFAGGTVVHMSAGVAALACALYLKGRSEMVHNPSRITYVLLGTGLLWFGWIGFNGGSAFGANDVAVLASLTTTIASATAMLAWLAMDAVSGKQPSALNACVGAVVGLVAITPAAGLVTPVESIVVGVVSALVSNAAIRWRASKTSIDDTLDVFPSHGIGGMVGMLLTGVFADAGSFLVQLAAMTVVALYVFLMTHVLLRVTDRVSPLRVDQADEKLGLDITQHGEKL